MQSVCKIRLIIQKVRKEIYPQPGGEMRSFDEYGEDKKNPGYQSGGVI